MTHSGKAPHGHNDHVPDACTNLVHERSGSKKAKRVGNLKCICNIAVADFRHAYAVLESGLENRDHLAVHVVDRSGHKEHRTYGPSHMSNYNIYSLVPRSQRTGYLMGTHLTPTSLPLRNPVDFQASALHN